MLTKFLRDYTVLPRQQNVGKTKQKIAMTAVIYEISRYFSRLEPVVGFSGTDNLNMLSEFSINCHGNHILEKK